VPYDETGFMEEAAEKPENGRLTFYDLRHPTPQAGQQWAPLAFVAGQLGHLCPSGMADAIRLLAPTLGIGGSQAVRSLDIKKA
jgi:hypothetical protein